MNKKLIGYIIVIIGAGMQIISLAADFLGLGNDPLNIGWKQLLGAGVGLLVIFVGIWFLSTAKDKNVQQKIMEADTFSEEEEEEEEEQEEML